MNNKLRKIVLAYLSKGPEACIGEEVKTNRQIWKVEDITWKELVNVFLRNREEWRWSVTINLGKLKIS